MLRNLVFIRHSQSRPEAGVPARLWGLTMEGRRRCTPLTAQLIPYNLDLIVTSIETKAIETGELAALSLGIPYQVAENLHEHARETAPYFESREQFQEAVVALFESPAVLVFGEETGLEAQERFANAVKSVMESNPRKNIAIVTHGTVLSLFVNKLTGCAIIPFWQGLGMPAIVAFSYPAMELLTQMNEII